MTAEGSSESPSTSKALSADVIIVGLGPVGAVAANLLGKYGVRTIVFEKEQEIYTGPRRVLPPARALRFHTTFIVQGGRDRRRNDANIWNGRFEGPRIIGIGYHSLAFFPSSIWTRG